jgi:hypothetical protein
MSPTLLVLAAGMGSRYGGLKQIDRFGPSGETMMDYAIYDALAAGFTKVVFIIRHSFEAEFREAVGGKYENRIAVDYVFQELEELPPGFSVHEGRTNPWGTTHAIWCARARIHEPFACVNADDYYGKSAFSAVAQYLIKPAAASPVPEYCVVGYPVLKTLSEHGPVARAICELDGEGYLTALTERTSIERWGSTARFVDENGSVRLLKGDEVVSMNMMGFAPAVFPQLERHLTSFLEAQKRAPSNAECVLPVVIGRLLQERVARMRALPTTDAWFGVTHVKDKPGAIQMIGDMVARGEYPSPIWGKT